MALLERRYLEAVVESRLYSNVRNLKNYLHYCYEGIDTPSCAAILDIGGGSGVVSLYGLVRGAASAVILEPESDGCESVRGAEEGFMRLSRIFDTHRSAFFKVPFESFQTEDRFSLVILHNSINHLNENAAENVTNDSESQSQYEGMFRKIYGLLRPGGQVVIFDCSSRNIFAAVGLKNPLMPTIEWHKHQPPEVWIELLSNAGFSGPVVDWTVPNVLGKRMKKVLNKKLYAFLLFSHFKLIMQREPLPGQVDRIA